MVIIGLSSVPAGGKSTVAAHLADLGATWINADRIAHTVLEMPEVTQRVIDYFGAAIIGVQGKIDRQQLAKQVFGDDDSSLQGLRYLESVIHPSTRQLMIEMITLADQADAFAVTLDVPLLFESNWAISCDEILFIDTPSRIQSLEAQRRGWSTEALNLRQSRQWPIDEKRRLSTRVVPNDGTVQELKASITEFWQELTIHSNRASAEQPRDPHCHPSRQRTH
jgi:dephospho-CoA kinase